MGSETLERSGEGGETLVLGRSSCRFGRVEGRGGRNARFAGG